MGKSVAVFFFLLLFFKALEYDSKTLMEFASCLFLQQPGAAPPAMVWLCSRLVTSVFEMLAGYILHIHSVLLLRIQRTLA